MDCPLVFFSFVALENPGPEDHLYLDGDPVATTMRARDRAADAAAALPATAAAAAQSVISTPLRTIIPWQDW